MALKRPPSPSPPSPPSSSPHTLYESSPINDRSSRFIGIYSPNLSAKELQKLAQFKDATHRISAWRLPSTQRSLSSQPLYDTGHDDDGERYGGKNLASVLTEFNIEGAIVVGRWYGGIMLGPVRFDHIKNCAREAVRKALDDRERVAKRAKVIEEDARRRELVRVLPERDQSISVLRGLLAEKQNVEKSDKEDGAVKAETKSPAKVPDYGKLPLKALESLEKARDATIGWILKEIEKVEAAQEAKPKEGVAAQECELTEADMAELASAETTSECEYPMPDEAELARAEKAWAGLPDMDGGAYEGKESPGTVPGA